MPDCFIPWEPCPQRWVGELPTQTCFAWTLCWKWFAGRLYDFQRDCDRTYRAILWGPGRKKRRRWSWQPGKVWWVQEKKQSTRSICQTSACVHVSVLHWHFIVLNYLLYNIICIKYMACKTYKPTCKTNSWHVGFASSSPWLCSSTIYASCPELERARRSLFSPGSGSPPRPGGPAPHGCSPGRSPPSAGRRGGERPTRVHAEKQESGQGVHFSVHCLVCCYHHLLGDVGTDMRGL